MAKENVQLALERPHERAIDLLLVVRREHQVKPVGGGVAPPRVLHERDLLLLAGVRVRGAVDY